MHGEPAAAAAMRLSRAVQLVAVIATPALLASAQDAGIVSSTTSSKSGDYCRWVSFTGSDDAPAPRFGHTLVIYVKKMVLFGGYDGSFRCVDGRKPLRARGRLGLSHMGAATSRGTPKGRGKRGHEQNGSLEKNRAGRGTTGGERRALRRSESRIVSTERSRVLPAV